MRCIVFFGVILQVCSIQTGLLAQNDTVPAYQFESTLYYKSLLLPNLGPTAPGGSLFKRVRYEEPVDNTFNIKVSDGPLRGSHGTAIFMHIVDSTGQILSTKLLDIKIYSGPRIYDWVIFAGEDQSGRIYQGITFDQLRSIKMNEITKFAATKFFERELKYRRYELYDVIKKKGSPYLRAENIEIALSHYNPHLMPKDPFTREDVYKGEK